MIKKVNGLGYRKKNTQEAKPKPKRKQSAAATAHPCARECSQS